jgi:hypothetical protein
VTDRSRAIAGWIAVVLGTGLTCFWAFWGIIENFHEGWYDPSLMMKLGMMVAQYLSPMLLFVLATLAAIRWPRVGGAIFFAFAIGSAWFFRGASWMAVYVTIAMPLALLGLLFWIGRARPRTWAVALLLGAAALTLVVSGAYPAWRVLTRVDDGDRGARTVKGNGVELVWAPQGPGWPEDGVTWFEAKRRCEYLNADGTALAATPQHHWRLPTLEEAVASSAHHGRNCGGTWDAARASASFPACEPDKEPPLWNPQSKVIYWWTASAAPGDRIYRMAYNGHVMPLRPQMHWGYLGFRAVKAAVR